MTAPRSFPFGGVPVYNPQSLTKGEALAQFHARQDAYERLLALLRLRRYTRRLRLFLFHQQGRT